MEILFIYLSSSLPGSGDDTRGMTPRHDRTDREIRYVQYLSLYLPT